MAIAGAAGYVLGARAGRQRYEQIVDQAQRVWSNPKVQQATRTAQDKAKEKAPVVGEMLTSKVKGSSEESTPPPVIVTPAVDATDPLVDPLSSAPAPSSSLDDDRTDPLSTSSPLSNI
jgi:hypothetical protein